MPPSAQDALRKARTNIKAAGNAQAPKRTVIKHYQAAKRALDQIDDMQENIASLNEKIAAFKDLAIIFDRLDEQGRATKCRRRAETLSQKFESRLGVCPPAITPSIIGQDSSPAIAQAGVARLNSPAQPSNTVFTLAAINSSVATQVNAASAAAISTLAASVTSVPFFSKDANPVSYVCPVPSPGRPLQSTRQLAYCLALLQDSIQEDDVSPEFLDWRRSALSRPSEKKLLDTLSIQILELFVNDTMKDSSSVAEVMHLAPVLEGEYSRSLLTAFIDAVNKSEILHLNSMEGLAYVIRGTAPGSINSNDLVAILRSLLEKLESAHSASHHNHFLLLAVSRALDAMADAHYGDVDRVKLYGPLADLLRESESNKDPYLAFQAAYAMQALLNVSNDENIWHAGFRRVWLVLKGGAGLAKTPSPADIGDALDYLEELYKAGKEGIKLIKDVKEAIHYGERPTFTKEEGLKFKRAWYRAVRTAESYIQAGNLVQFKDLVITAPCRHQLMFQWGICQLLGQFAIDAQWNSETRQGAVAFLRALYMADQIWQRQKEVDQVIFDALTNVTVKDMSNEAAKSTLEEMKKQNPALKPKANLQSPLWNSVRFADSAERTTPKGTLLRAVQDKNVRHSKLDSLLNFPKEPGLHEVQSALRVYHQPDLFIHRVSGQELDLETCYVNLAIVEAQEQRETERQNLKDRLRSFTESRVLKN